MKLKKAFRFIAIACLLTTMLGYSTFALVSTSDNTPIRSEQYPVFTGGYDETLADGNHGWSVMGYQTGTLFDWWCCRSFTEVWCDDEYAISAYSAYVYALVENKNKTNERETSSNSTIDSHTRTCGTYTSRIDARYATHLRHESRLIVNGESQWDIDKGIKAKP